VSFKRAGGLFFVFCIGARADTTACLPIELIRRRPDSHPRPPRLPRESWRPGDKIGLGNSTRKLTRGTLELISRWPEKWKSASPGELFYEWASMSDGNKVNSWGSTTQRGNYHFDYANLKRSTRDRGASGLPLGLFRFSYGVPLNALPGKTVKINDETERFNFLSASILDRSLFEVLIQYVTFQSQLPLSGLLRVRG